MLNRNRVLETRVCKASFINSISTWKTLSMSSYEKTPQKRVLQSRVLDWSQVLETRDASFPLSFKTGQLTKLLA